MDDVQSLIEWRKMQNIIKLGMPGMYVIENRIAHMKNLREIEFKGVRNVDLDDFVIEGLEVLTSKWTNGDLIEVIMKHGTLKKVKIDFKEMAKFLEMPKHLPELNELHLSGHNLDGMDETFATNVIKEFMLNCDNLKSIVVGGRCSDKTSDCLESIKDAIEKRFDRREWYVGKHVFVKNSDYYVWNHISKKQKKKQK